jgi:predicted lactoylglutathione lyase
MVWSETINVMLLTHAKWRHFTSRPVSAKDSSEVMLAISCDDRNAVDQMNDAAAKHGGTADKSEAGSGIHVQPKSRRSRWTRVGSHVDGPIGDCAQRLMP